MNNEALVGISATLLLALIGTVWKAGTIVAKLQATLDHVTSTVVRLELGLKQLEEIPSLRQRIGQLEAYREELSRRLDAVWHKVFSHDKHLAVIRERTASSPGFTEHDTDPPTD